MRKVVLNLAVSIDGFIEDAIGKFDWCFIDQDYSEGQFQRFDAVFMGRKSYELMVNRKELPMGEKKIYIFSNSMKSAEYGTVIGKDFEEEVYKIKNEAGQDIWFFGGANLLTSFLDKNLIDELQLAIHPIMLGAGKRLFEGKINRRINCQLIHAKSFSDGLVMLKYKLV